MGCIPWNAFYCALMDAAMDAALAGVLQGLVWLPGSALLELRVGSCAGLPCPHPSECTGS